MPFPIEPTPTPSTNTNLFVFRDTTNNSLYLCIGSVPLSSSQNITNRTQLPANTKCAKLIDDAASGINSTCPSAGSIYPEKSYATYDSINGTLTVYESTVTNNANCSYTTATKTVPIPSYAPPKVRLYMFYTGCPSWMQKPFKIVDSNTSNTVSVDGILADNLCSNYAHINSVSDGDNGMRYVDTSNDIPVVAAYQGLFGISSVYGILMVVWENQDPNRTLNFSFSCTVPERRIGFKGNYHQMSNIVGGSVIDRSFSIVNKNTNTTLYTSPPFSAKLFPVAAYPGSQSNRLQGWCTISAHISPNMHFIGYSDSSSTPAHTYSVPVFAEWF